MPAETGVTSLRDSEGASCSPQLLSDFWNLLPPRVFTVMANSALPTQGWGAAPPGKKWLQRQGPSGEMSQAPLEKRQLRAASLAPIMRGPETPTGAKGQGQERPFPDTLPKVPPFPGKRGGPSREALALPGILGRKRGPWRLGRRRMLPWPPAGMCTLMLPRGDIWSTEPPLGEGTLQDVRHIRGGQMRNKPPSTLPLHHEPWGCSGAGGGDLLGPL